MKMEHKVLIINAYGSIPESLSVKGMDLPGKRRDVIQKVISDEKPDYILMQESTNCNLKYICNQDFGNKKYKNFDIENNPNKDIDAAIIYDSTKYKLCKDPTYTNCALRFVCAFTQHKINEKLDISADEIVSRMSAVILQDQCQNTQPFLCVSWHGPYKKTIKERKKTYYDLCLLLSLYSYERKIPVILGGDFNLDLMSVTVTSVCWPSTKPVCYNIVVNDYTKLDNRPEKIDYILTSETFTNVCCKPINILDIVDSLFPYLTLHYAKAILGNDCLALHATSSTDTFGDSSLFLKSKDKVLAMNAKKLVPDSLKNKREDLSNLRIEVMYQVIKDENPDIILIQESNFQLNNICAKLKMYKAVDEENLGRIYQATGGEDAEINQAIGGEDAENQAIGGEDARMYQAIGGEDAENQAIGGEDARMYQAIGGEDAENQAIGGEDDRMYQAIERKDAGIIFNTKKFIVHTSCEETRKQLFDLYVSKYGNIPPTLSNVFLEGICAVILKQKCSNAQPFLCVSCHGSHFKLSKCKVNEFLELFIYRYSDEKKVPLILGKDFNLERPNNPYRIFISDTNNSLWGTKNVDTWDIIENIDISCPKLYLCLKMVFDHDPLICTITQP